MVPYRLTLSCQVQVEVGLETERFRLKFNRKGNFLLRFCSIASFCGTSNGTPSHLILFYIVLDQTHTRLGLVQILGWYNSK